MPTIPLLKVNTDLAMPQVPALDRMPRPQIDVRGVLMAMEDLARASQRPDINPAPFVEAAGAKGKAVGKGLMDIGDVMGALAMKRMEAIDERYIQEAHADIQVAQKQIAGLRESNEEPSALSASATKIYDGVVKRYAGISKKLSRDGQERMGLLLRTNGQMIQATVKADTDMAIFAKTRDAIAENVVGDMERGDYAGARERLDDGVARSFFHQEDAAARLREINRAERDDALWTVVRDHPREAPEWFQDEAKLAQYKLSSWERKEWRHRALLYQAENEQQAVGAILIGLAEGKIREPDDLRGWKPRLSEDDYAQISSLLSTHEDGVPTNDDAMMEQKISEIESLEVSRDVKSLRSVVKLVTGLSDHFVGPKLEELKGRLAARINQQDSERPNVLGPTLARLNQWAYHDGVGGVLAVPGVFARVTSEVQSIRKGLEAAHKAGTITTEEEALDFAAQKVISLGWVLSRNDNTTIA
jgi:hypothetical protein